MKNIIKNILLQSLRDSYTHDLLLLTSLYISFYLKFLNDTLKKLQKFKNNVGIT